MICRICIVRQVQKSSRSHSFLGPTANTCFYTKFAKSSKINPNRDPFERQNLQISKKMLSRQQHIRHIQKPKKNANAKPSPCRGLLLVAARWPRSRGFSCRRQGGARARRGAWLATPSARCADRLDRAVCDERGRLLAARGAHAGVATKADRLRPRS